jgi:hypothetical protein
VCAAIYYCHDRFEDVSVKYIQACRFHQSALESVFAVIRATAGTSNSKQSADALATMAMGRSVKTLSRGHMYDVMEDDDASTRINVFLTKTEKENQQKQTEDIISSLKSTAVNPNTSIVAEKTSGETIAVLDDHVEIDEDVIDNADVEKDDNANIEEDLIFSDQNITETSEHYEEEVYTTDSQLTFVIFDPSDPTGDEEEMDITYTRLLQQEETIQEVGELSQHDTILTPASIDYYSKFVESIRGSSLWLEVTLNANFKDMVTLKYATNSTHEWFDEFLALRTVEVANQVEKVLWDLMRNIFLVIEEFQRIIVTRKLVEGGRPTDNEQNYVENKLYAFITTAEFDMKFQDIPFISRYKDVDRIIVFDALKDIAKQFVYRHRSLQRPTKQTPIVSNDDQAYEVQSFAGWALQSSIKVIKDKMNRVQMKGDEICDTDKRTMQILQVMRQFRHNITEEEEKGEFLFHTKI